MRSVELVAVKPNKGEIFHLEVNDDSFILVDGADEAVTNFSADAARSCIRLPGFFGGKYIEIEGRQGRKFLFKAKKRAVEKIRDILKDSRGSSWRSSLSLRAQAGISLGVGLLLVVVGIIITAISYNNPDAKGTFRVMTGMIVCGIIGMVRGIYGFASGGDD